MSRFKTQPVDTNNVGSWVERRRKGRMIRLQHTVTGKWSPWRLDPYRPHNVHKTVQPTIREAALATVKADATEQYGRMTVTELKELATSRGIPFKSKVTKPVLINALTA